MNIEEANYVRQAFADYIYATYSVPKEEAEKRLANFLKVEQYTDGSGYNWEKKIHDDTHEIHWTGCYTDPSHHKCALRKIEEQRARYAKLLEDYNLEVDLANRLEIDNFRLRSEANEK